MLISQLSIPFMLMICTFLYCNVINKLQQKTWYSSDRDIFIDIEKTYAFNP